MNRRVLTVIVCVMAVTNIASADIVQGINLDFVTIGNAGNPADTTGYGAVGYEYRIGKYEITNAQWNQLADAPTGTDCGYGGSATYTGDQQPANSISWYEALQFCNYLTSGDKSQGVYQFTGNSADPGGFIGIDTDTTAIATYGTVYRLPTEDEWYKAAYHKNDGVTGNYWLYPTQSDSVPSNDLIDPDPGNNANFWQDGGYTIGSPDYLTNVGDFENSDSAYGTFDQAGNVWEWNEALIGSYRGVRSGAVGIDESHFASSSARYSTFGPCYADGTIGFRVASVPEPVEPACGFSDDFTGTALDKSLWSVFVDAHGQYHWPYVAGGLLHSQGYHTRIDSIPTFAPRGQSVIARASINLAGIIQKFGFAPNPNERDGPITGYYFDTVEGPTNTVRALAWFQPASGSEINLLDVEIPVTWYEFHEFAIERTPSEVIYLIDGQEVARVADAFAGALPVGVWNDRWSLMQTDWVEVNCESAEPEWSFAHMTDTHIGSSRRDRRHLATAIQQITKLDPKPELIIVTGDIAHYGCDKNSNCHRHYKDYLKAIKRAVQKGIEVYSVPGNHDRVKPDMSNCDNYLDCYNNCINSMRPDDTNDLIAPHDYYFEHNGFLFIGLDSGEGFPQGTGLSEDQITALESLGSTESITPKVVFMHHPGVDIDDDGILPDEDVSIGQNKPEFLDWCDSNNVQLVLAGHSHQNHVYDRNGNELPPSSITRPLYIQTPSVSGWTIPIVHDPLGYRIIDVQGTNVYPSEYTPLSPLVRIIVSLFSPANIHVYDFLGRHVGIVDANEEETDIPDSFYFSHYVVSTDDGNEVFPEEIIIFEPNDDYLYEVVGTETGTYLLQISFGEDDNEVIFEANDIPTSPGAVHAYTIDWDVLSEGGDGVIVAVDADGDGDFERTITADNELTLQEFDTEPPTINSASANPDVLWPVNHKMVEVAVTVDAEDICDPAPVSKIVNVTSNEPINGLGDGNTKPDWEITGALTVNLRTERSGKGSGRVYTIHVECTDACGNTTIATVDVTVPHDQGKSK